ncbi:MAG: molybdenum cofactor guanylyltransferase [Actinomycetota bacterium]
MKALAGLVLCGGESRRMGMDEALLALEGRPLVLRVAERLARVADPILLAPGRPGRLGDLGYQEVADKPPGTGPLAGLVAGLAASPHRLIATLAVDMPLASPEVFRLLAELHKGEDAVVPVTASGPEPLHAVFDAAALASLRASLSERRRGLREALSRLRVREVSEAEWREADQTGRFATNVNRASDLAALGDDDAGATLTTFPR